MHPYSDLPDRQFWRRAISVRPWREVEFFPSAKFGISRQSRIATAGSCFAQHIASFLRRSGVGLYCTETSHPLLSAEQAGELNYGQFSARYGNVYTVRQMLELTQQALGQRAPIMDIEMSGDGFFDLLRPSIQKGGFSCREEAEADRLYHLGRVKVLFETADVFVFTLGLTESWYSVQGHTYPACPGTVVGSFDPGRHRYCNHSHQSIMDDLRQFLTLLRNVNSELKVILTVSPVHLVATKEELPVIVASTYSKSTLRSVCGEIVREFDNVDYFPSFEIVLSAASFGQYLESDLRGIAERGVEHVMAVFWGKYFGAETVRSADTPVLPARATDSVDLARKMLEAECDEMFNDPSLSRQDSEK